MQLVEKAEDVTQLVEGLPILHKALCFIPSTTQKLGVVRHPWTSPWEVGNRMIGSSRSSLVTFQVQGQPWIHETVSKRKKSVGNHQIPLLI